MEKDFAGKKYLVTGVGSGIGRSLAIQLSNMGAEVWGVSKTKANLDSLAVRQHFEFIYNIQLMQIVDRKSVLHCTQ